MDCASGKSKNHRTPKFGRQHSGRSGPNLLKFGRQHCGWSGPNLLLRQGQLEHMAQNCIHRTPKSFSTELLSRSTPRLCWSMGLSFPRCRTALSFVEFQTVVLCPSFQPEGLTVLRYWPLLPTLCHQGTC